MAKTYKIENTGTRPTSIRVRGGVETVPAGKTRVLEVAAAFDKETIATYKERGVNITSSSDEPENKSVALGGAVADRRRDPVQPADNPAETGGVVPRSSVSERGGVDRKPTDTTTTTKPTEQQTGAKA